MLTPSAGILTHHPQFVEAKYHLELNASATSQLNRAIAAGSERGTFVLPKGMRISVQIVDDILYVSVFVVGPSGKVRLAPKVRSDAAKEVRIHARRCMRR